MRSPLTRNYLTSVERRLQKVEALFAELLPDVNLEALLGSSTVDPLAFHTASTSNQWTIDETASAKEGENIYSEALPDETYGFDWREQTTEFNDLADGMASLSVEPTGKGYLGSTSGVVFLRSLLSWTKVATSESGSQPDTVSSGDPNRAFSIFRASEEILSQQLMGQFLDAYFANYHVSYPFVHEGTFRAQYNELIPRGDRTSWDMLRYTILALGAWTLGSDRSDMDEILYQKASSISQGDTIFEMASLTLVQALILLSNFAQKRNKPNTGWNFLGLAVRMALSLGLHRELPEWGISLLQREMRRRVWWGLFIFDSGASTTFGRAILSPPGEMMDVKQVLNIHDLLLTPRTGTVPTDLAEPTIYSSLRAQAEFHLRSNHISNRLLSSPLLSVEEALNLNQALESWANGLPHYFRLDQPPSNHHQWYQFARARLWWRHWNMQIILFRPVLLRSVVKSNDNKIHDQTGRDDSKAREICLSSAHSTIASICNYVKEETFTRLVAWYSLYFLFHAALIPCFCLLADSQSIQVQSWNADIEETRKLLDTAFVNNPLAARCADILKRLLPGSWTSSGETWPEAPNNGGFDFSTWDMDAEDPFVSFEWPNIWQEN